MTIKGNEVWVTIEGDVQPLPLCFMSISVSVPHNAETQPALLAIGLKRKVVHETYNVQVQNRQ